VINKYSALAWVVLLLFMLAGCESFLIQQQKSVKDEVVLEKYKDVPMRELLNKVQSDFAKAKDDSLYFYSPNNYNTARIGLQTARAYFRDPERKTQVLKSIYKADMAIKDGYVVKGIVDREMSEVISLRISLDDLEARKYQGREYQGLATSTAKLVEEIEYKKEAIFQDPGSKTRFEKQKQELIVAMKDFRVRVVKQKYLSEGGNLLAEANRYDAEKLAPLTYAAAIKSRDEAVTYIEQNIDNLAGIQQQSEQFEFAAYRLLHVAREISNIQALKDDTYEQYVLREEERLSKISKALKTGDIRNLNFTTQASQLASNARQMVRQKETNALKIAEINTSLPQAASENVVVPIGSPGDGPQPIAQQSQPVVVEDPLIAGVAGGDLETLKNSVRILTDQLYRLTLENSELKGQRDMLKSRLDKLEAEINQQSSAAQKSGSAQSQKTKPQTKDKPVKNQADSGSKKQSAETQSQKSSNPKEKGQEKEQPQTEKSASQSKSDNASGSNAEKQTNATTDKNQVQNPATSKTGE